MNRRKIHIENLKIRLPKNSGLSARELAAGLGNDLLRQIAETTRHEIGTQRVEKIEVPVKNSGDASGGEFQRRIVRRIAAEIGGKSKQGES